MSVAEIRRALLSAADVDADLVYRQQADQFEEELLGREEIPEPYLELFVEIISEPSLAKRPAVWNFFIRMIPDRDKLGARQLQKVADAIGRSYGLYRGEQTQLLAGDFVARACEPAVALEVFRAMSEGAKDKKGRNAIRVGLETTMNSLPSNSRERERYVQLYEALL